MGFPEEGKQCVMLTKRKEIDILNNHHLFAIFLLEHGTAKHGSGIFLISFRQELHGFGNTFGRFQQTFAVYIFTKQIDNAFIIGCQFFRNSKASFTSLISIQWNFDFFLNDVHFFLIGRERIHQETLHVISFFV